MILHISIETIHPYILYMEAQGKSSESVQCAVTSPYMRMHHRPSA